MPRNLTMLSLRPAETGDAFEAQARHATVHLMRDVVRVETDAGGDIVLVTDR